MYCMTWWQTLISTSAPVFITLLITLSAESRRRAQDLRERQKDRDRDDLRLHTERAFALQDVHRTERLDMYKQMLISTETAVYQIKTTLLGKETGALQHQMRALQTLLGHPPEEREPLEDYGFVGVSQDLWIRVSGLASQIALLGGDDVRREATALAALVESLGKEAERAAKKLDSIMDDSAAIASYSGQDWDDFTRPLVDQREAFAAAARIEVGTVPPAPGTPAQE